MFANEDIASFWLKIQLYFVRQIVAGSKRKNYKNVKDTFEPMTSDALIALNVFISL